MFFPERIKNIKPSDRVLEIGPGGLPHHRSDVFLEKIFDDPHEEVAQRGYAPQFKDSRKIVFYNSDKFPFKDNEFDYVICSHVLEHVDDVNVFLSEIVRVATKGYLEYPTIYYDYLYNINEHITLLMYKDNLVRWMPKKDSGINQYNGINEFFRETINVGYLDIIHVFKNYFFQGFEWQGTIRSEKVDDISKILLNLADTPVIYNESKVRRVEKILLKIQRKLQDLRKAIKF